MAGILFYGLAVLVLALILAALIVVPAVTAIGWVLSVARRRQLLRRLR